MNFKLVLAIMMLLQAGIHVFSAEEIKPSTMIEKAIMDSDEVRIMYLVSTNVETYTGYRSKTPKGKQVLADIFSKAEFLGLGNPDGTQDPTGGAGFATSSGMRLNVYKNKQVTHEMIIIGFEYIHLLKPEDSWYEVSLDGISKDDNTVSAYVAAIELRILRAVKNSSSAGDWEEVLTNLAGFMPGSNKRFIPIKMP